MPAYFLGNILPRKVSGVGYIDSFLFCTFFAGGLSVRDGNGMKEWEEASITIEAAIIMSMAMLLFLIVMKLGLQLYGETRTLAEDVIKEETLNALKLFYEIERVKGLF